MPSKAVTDMIQRANDRIKFLEDALRTVRRAFAHKYNEREIAIIDAAIGPIDPVDEVDEIIENHSIATFYAEGTVSIPYNEQERLLWALNKAQCGRETMPLEERCSQEHQKATGNLLGHHSVKVLVDVRKNGDWILRGVK